MENPRKHFKLKGHSESTKTEASVMLKDKLHLCDMPMTKAKLLSKKATKYQVLIWSKRVIIIQYRKISWTEGNRWLQQQYANQAYTLHVWWRYIEWLWEQIRNPCLGLNFKNILEVTIVADNQITMLIKVLKYYPLQTSSRRLNVNEISI